MIVYVVVQKEPCDGFCVKHKDIFIIYFFIGINDSAVIIEMFGIFKHSRVFFRFVSSKFCLTGWSFREKMFKANMLMFDI